MADLEHGKRFVVIPVDVLFEELNCEDVVRRKVHEMARKTLGVEAITLRQTLVECYAEQHLGRHPLEECEHPDTVRLHYYVFQEDTRG